MNELLNARALLIARTESTHSANRGQGELWLQARDNGDLPTNQQRVWIATDDDDVRETHWDANGQVVGLEEPFEVGGRFYMYPSEPNCRCAVGLHVEGVT